MQILPFRCYLLGSKIYYPTWQTPGPGGSGLGTVAIHDQTVHHYHRRRHHRRRHNHHHHLLLLLRNQILFNISRRFLHTISVSKPNDAWASETTNWRQNNACLKQSSRRSHRADRLISSVPVARSLNRKSRPGRWWWWHLTWTDRRELSG